MGGKEEDGGNYCPILGLGLTNHWRLSPDPVGFFVAVILFEE